LHHSITPAGTEAKSIATGDPSYREQLIAQQFMGAM
jgi:hypothetical protein